MSQTQSLVFFNNQGDSLNFKYNDFYERYEGDLLFNENGNDTFKTIGLYTFEYIPSYEYQLPGTLGLDKFQLFNETRFTISGSSYSRQPVKLIDIPNVDPNFYSKWVYGIHFEAKFPIGSQIKFDNSIFEFTNPDQNYTVIETKKDAIMIISNVDNSTYDTLYSTVMGLTSSYVNVTISGINAIGVYNYADISLNPLLSQWSEPLFFTKYYVGKKLTVLNTKKNDGVYTVNNINLFDRKYEKYTLGRDVFTASQDLAVEVILLTEPPLIYSGPLNLSGSILDFSPGFAPSGLKPGIEFSIPTSNYNTDYYVVDAIPSFIGNNTLTYYDVGNQVMWNSRVYQCVQSYTWSGTSSITPDNFVYWQRPKYLPITTSFASEILPSAEIHLTTNVFSYFQTFTQSNEITLATFAQKYANDFLAFNINLYYQDHALHSDLIYPSKYAEVNYYPYVIATSSSWGTEQLILEQTVGIKENLKPELAIDNCSRPYYNIVFNELDEFGIIITINGHKYQVETDYVYVGLTLNMPRTIDKTLRLWLSLWYSRLYSIGVIPTLQYKGTLSSIYYNSINFLADYPNVQCDFTVELGSVGTYYIEHSDVLFTNIGPYLTITVNGKKYGQQYDTSVSNTVTLWVESWSNILLSFGIIVSNINNLLIFRIKTQSTKCHYTINVNRLSLPGIPDYTITNKIFGHFGNTITSNEIILADGATDSFINNSFASGQVVTINNTVRPWDNQGYNLLHITDNNLVLSYQGPFWGTVPVACEVSPFVNLAFSSGFSATGCEPPIIPPYNPDGGEFDLHEYDPAFTLHFASTNNYTSILYPLSGNTNLVDILYVQLTNCVYVLGLNLSVIDSNTGLVVNTINLAPIGYLIDNTYSMLYNPVNSYIYIHFNSAGLGGHGVIVVDVLTNTIVQTFSAPSFASTVIDDMIVNTLNGDVYVSHPDVSFYEWVPSNISLGFTSHSTSGTTHKMVYSDFENGVYILVNSGTGQVIRIKGSTRLLDNTFSGFIGLELEQIGYEPINGSVYVFDTTNGLIQIRSNTTTTISSIPYESGFADILFNNINGDVLISQQGTDTYYSRIGLDGTLISQSSTTTYGRLAINQYDGDVYVGSLSSNQVKVFDTISGTIKHSESFYSTITKLTYNPNRRSIWGIEPGNNTVVEIGVYVNSQVIPVTPTYSIVPEDNYGTLNSGYIKPDALWLKTREYIRRPRENYENDNRVQYIWKLLDDTKPQMFLYDFSGDQLQFTNTGSFSYLGQSPLTTITLNTLPNRDLQKVYLPEYQQTVFEEVIKDLEYVDSSTDFSMSPTPMETFLGFKGDDEGPMDQYLVLYRRETFSMSVVSNSTDIIQFEVIKDNDNGWYGIVALSLSSGVNFQDKGFKVGQWIQIFVRDITNKRNKYISVNNGKKLKIRSVFTYYLIVDFIDMIENEFSKIDDYPIVGQETYLQVDIVSIDKEIGRFHVYGQTEIEDIRYKIELSNIGQNILPDDVFIFKSYDVNEQGIDWGFINKKRKEMLMVKNQIFPYVGSYKAIINTINYFGYNDLQLYEYYRNININSPLFYKLFKVEIPDIFDNTVKGWTVNDFIKHTMPNPNYETTNLFNLTYLITDKEGNNVLQYSLQEVIMKLQGLKHWLERKVIPITHKILDITGRADFVGVDSIVHRNYDVKILNLRQEFTPIDFKLNEAYLQPVNSGSTVYTCHVDFYNATSSVLPDFYTINIRTFQTYKEWNPFTTYNIGDRVSYYGYLYESVIDENKINDPRKYGSMATNWTANVDYLLGDMVKYSGYIYEYIGTQSSYQTFGTSSIPTPASDINLNHSLAHWLDITQWKNLDYMPVQNIFEYRTGTQSFNFTIDSNIDPFILIEITSGNGYGQIYTSKKNYEIRGLNDLGGTIKYIENIGPFIPIVQITTPTIGY